MNIFVCVFNCELNKVIIMIRFFPPLPLNSWGRKKIFNSNFETTYHIHHHHQLEMVVNNINKCIDSMIMTIPQNTFQLAIPTHKHTHTNLLAAHIAIIINVWHLQAKHLWLLIQQINSFSIIIDDHHFIHSFQSLYFHIL